jgi:hypothetical protein
LSRDYKIDINIDKEFTEENIQILLLKLIEHGAAFYKYDLDNIFESMNDLLSINDAMKKNVELDCYAIIIKYKQAILLTLISERQNKIGIYICQFFYSPRKFFKSYDSEDFDMAKCSNLIWELLSEYRIIEFKILKD